MIEIFDKKVQSVFEVVESDASAFRLRRGRGGINLFLFLLDSGFLARERFVDNDDDVFVSEMAESGRVENVVAVETRFFKLNQLGWTRNWLDSYGSGA